MKILLPIDGSQCSLAAVNCLLKMNHQPDTEVRVISIVDFVEPLPSVEGGKEKEIEDARKLVKDSAARVQAALPNLRVTSDVLDGYAKERIVQEAHNWQADLIIMGSHGG